MLGKTFLSTLGGESPSTESGFMGFSDFTSRNPAQQCQILNYGFAYFYSSVPSPCWNRLLGGGQLRIAQERLLWS